MNDCQRCGNVGLFVAVHKVSHAQYGFRCECPIGRAKFCVAIPLWSGKYAKEYEISHVYTAKKEETPEVVADQESTELF